MAKVEDAADGLPQAVDGALGGLAQVHLEPGERLLDRVEVGAVGRKEEQLGAIKGEQVVAAVTRIASV